MSYRLGRGKHTCTKVLDVGEVAMHENADGSYRTVTGDGKTPLNELPTFSGEQHFTLRDTFAAAALTGLLAEGDDGSFSEEPYVRAAYRWADAMLRERVKTSAEKTCGSGTVTPAADHENDEKRAVWPTIHGAVPEAIARTDAASDRTDKAATSHRRDGTGETPSEAEIDALQHVVEDGRLVDLSDYGRLRSLLVRLRPEWEGTTPPRNARDHQRRGEDDD